MEIMAIYQVGLAQQITYAWGAELAAEQHHRTGLGMRRAEAAGPSSDRFTPRQPELVVQFAVCSLAVVGAAFVPFFWSADMSADGGAPQPGVLQPGVNEFQQMMMVMLQQAIGTTAQGVGLTQQVTEGIGRCSDRGCATGSSRRPKISCNK